MLGFGKSGIMNNELINNRLKLLEITRRTNNE